MSRNYTSSTFGRSGISARRMRRWELDVEITDDFKAKFWRKQQKPLTEEEFFKRKKKRKIAKKNRKRK